MGRFATGEDEVDDLFRLGVFTDLYRVVRQGVRAGVENYSIKRLRSRQSTLPDLRHRAFRQLVAGSAGYAEG